MIYLDLIKAFALGICASAPWGPVALFVMQKSLNFGRKAGFASGLGSALMDTTYAALSVLALEIAEKFIERNELVIALGGGSIITVIGLILVFSDPLRERKEKRASRDHYSVGYAAQTFLMVLSNPAALFVMFGLMSAFNIETGGSIKAFVLMMVFMGAVSYWFVFSWVFSHLKRAVNYKLLSVVGRLAGVIIATFGLVLIVKGLKII